MADYFMREIRLRPSGKIREVPWQESSLCFVSACFLNLSFLKNVCLFSQFVISEKKGFL